MHFARKALLALSCVMAPAAIAQQMPPPPLAFYGDLPALEEAVISPSGALTALLMTSRGERVITVIDAEGTPVKQFTVGDARVRGIEWVGDEAILLLRTTTDRLPPQYISATGEAEFLRGNVIPLDDRREVISVFARQRSMVNAIFGIYGVRRVDGRWLGFFGGRRRGNTSGERDVLLDRQPALFAVDLLTGDVNLVDPPDDWPSLRDWLVDDAGNVGARITLEANDGAWTIENARGQTLVSGRQQRGTPSLEGFSADGSAVIYRAFDDTLGFAPYYSVPLAGGEPRRVFADLGTQRLIFAPNSARILGVQSRDGTLTLDDPADQQRLSDALAAFSFASFAQITDWTPDFSAMIATTSGNYDSGTWYRIDGTTGARTIVGLERPAIQGQVIGQVSTISYEAQDGLEIRAILTLPPGREPVNLPVIIFPHGGPTAHDIEMFDWWAQAFASRGYAVLQPNFRGSTGRGQAFVDAGDGEWGRAMQTDLSDGLAALAERGIADPDRACIMGASYGGYAALAGVTIQQGIYACSISVNGVSDVQAILREFRTGRRSIFSRDVDRQFGRSPDFAAISPVRNAESADAPILLIHAARDVVVPYQQSLVMLDALRDARKPVEFLELEGEDHYLSSATTRRQMLEAAMAFMLRHNPPD